MRFEHEKITTGYLHSQIRRKENETGRRVTRIVMTQPEWKEFLSNQPLIYTAITRSVHIPTPPTRTFARQYDDYISNETTLSVEVTYE